MKNWKDKGNPSKAKTVMKFVEIVMLQNGIIENVKLLHHYSSTRLDACVNEVFPLLFSKLKPKLATDKFDISYLTLYNDIKSFKSKQQSV
jgi:hypothetical protein